MGSAGGHFIFVVEKRSNAGRTVETTTVRDRGYTQAARQVVRKRGYKVAMLRITRPAYPRAALHYRVKGGVPKYEAWSPTGAS